MKKLLIFGAVVGVTFGTIVVPSVMVMRGFMSSLEKYTPESNENEESQVSTEVHDSNQGFEDLSSLNLNINLGDIDEVSTDFLINKIKSLNPQINESSIYIKGLTLKKVKFTVENYTGTAIADFKVRNLSALIKNKELGNLKDIQNTTIFNKIKDLNPSIPSEMNFEGELDVKVVSLNKIIIDWADQSTRTETALELTYKPMSLLGLLPSVDLGATKDVSIEYISQKILELNSISGRDASFLNNPDLYKFTFSNSNNQSAYNATLSLQTKENLSDFELYKFSDVEGDNTISITYSVNDISTLITNTDLGEIENFEASTILKKVLELNPLYKSYRGSDSLSNSIIEVNSIRNASIRNISLSGGTKALTFKVTNISKLITNTNLDTISQYIETNTSKIIEKIFEKNSKLSEFGIKSEDLKISERTIPAFGANDATIKNVKFNLSIANTDFLSPNNSIEMKFNIKREKLETALKNATNKTDLNLGNLAWKTTEDIINAVKKFLIDKVTGETIDLENEVTWGTPTYDYLELTSKESSFLYYGSAKISYKTNFLKTKDFNLVVSSGSNVGSQGQANVTTKEYLPSKLIATGGIQELGYTQFETEYAVPLGIDNAKKFRTSFVVNFTAKAKQATAKSSSGDISKSQKTNDIRINLDSNLNENSENAFYSFYEATLKVPFDTKGYGGIWKPYNCGYGDVENFQYISKITYASYVKVKDNVDYIMFIVKMTSTLSSNSTCNNFNGAWDLIINSMNLE